MENLEDIDFRHLDFLDFEDLEPIRQPGTAQKLLCKTRNWQFPKFSEIFRNLVHSVCRQFPKSQFFIFKNSYVKQKLV